MTHARYALLTVGFALAAALPARADDAKDARALVDKAIKAHGGADNVAKYHGSVVAFKGTFHGMGMELPMTGTISLSGADRLKADIEVEAGGMKLKIVNVVDGDKGWTRVGDNTTEMDKDAVAEAKEQMHAGWVGSLAPLVAAKGYTLATAGEQLVGEKPALGVKVSAKGRRDVTLYFDKATGLLVKYDSVVKDEGSGQEVTEETILADYKEVQGTKQAVKFTTKRDGKLYMEGEATDHQLSEKLDADIFAKP